MYDKRATNEPTWDDVCRRAGGRRKYNSVRQFKANYRLTRVAKLMRKTGFRRGYQTKIAKALGVHRSTVCRDVRRLHDRHWFGRAADKMLRNEAIVAKHARDDLKADREYEQRMLEARLAEATAPEPRTEPDQAAVAPTVQVSTWSPLSDRPPASRRPLARRSVRSPRRQHG